MDTGDFQEIVRGFSVASTMFGQAAITLQKERRQDFLDQGMGLVEASFNKGLEKEPSPARRQALEKMRCSFLLMYNRQRKC